MRRFLFTVVILFIANIPPTAAQIGESLRIGNTCSYFGEDIPPQVATFASNQEAERVIQDIVDASGLRQNFEIRAAGVPNAAAVIYGTRRYIIYNQYFMREMRETTGTRWAATSIMAHEIGHHLNGHTLESAGSRPRIELEADYYSGFVLQKMGASLEEARKAMALLGNPSGSSTHPPKHDRLASITNGWIKSCDSDPRCQGNGETTTLPSISREERLGVDSCKYARDGRCDEPDPCRPGTDTSDCRDRIPRTERVVGFPSGYGMKICGCWGPNPRPVREPRCASGWVRVSVCSGWCAPRHPRYAYVCE